MFIRALLRSTLALLVCTPALALDEPCTDGGPPPDRKFKDHRIATSGPETMEHGVADMIAFVRDSIDAGLADDMEEDLLTPDACVEVVELWGGRTGVSDATTIAVKTRGMRLWLSSVVLAHEYTHWTRARAAATPPPGGPPTPGNPHGGDPETSSANPCGECHHAAMVAADLGRIALFCEHLSAPDRQHLCDELFGDWRKRVAQSLTACLYAGCTSCCGFGYIPNVDELFPALPCCDG